MPIIKGLEGILYLLRGSCVLDGAKPHELLLLSILDGMNHDSPSL